jgi:hypothetical protein
LADELASRLEEAGDALALVDVRAAQLFARNLRGEHAAAAALGQ